MSEPFAVVVHRSDRNGRSLLFGPFDENEADALAERLRREFALDAEAERLRGWTDEDAARLK